jgi:hypothetical protein
MEVSAQTAKPAILLITDTYSRGWKATALSDSVQKSYRVMPGDAFARAIPLYAGQHHFVLKYEAPGFFPGLWISLGAFFLYLFAWAWLWKGRP